LYFSVISLCILYYFLQLACYNIWTRMTFNQTYTDGINDSYFFYVFTMELASFLFIRTRSSLKYFPKFITMANMVFLMYVNSYMYACQQESLNILQNFSLWVLLFFIRKFEYEAINNWNPFGTWTPSEINPRCGYHNIILSSQYSIGFDIFSIAYPLRFRETFPTQS